MALLRDDMDRIKELHPLMWGMYSESLNREPWTSRQAMGSVTQRGEESEAGEVISA